MPFFQRSMNSWGQKCHLWHSPLSGWVGVFSGVALVLVALIAVVVAGMSIAAKMGIHVNFIQNVIRQIKNRSKIAQAIAKRRFTAVLSLTLRSGLEFEKGLELAGGLAENDVISEQLKKML